MPRLAKFWRGIGVEMVALGANNENGKNNSCIVSLPRHGIRHRARRDMLEANSVCRCHQSHSNQRQGNLPPKSNFGSTHTLVFGNWIFDTTYTLPFVGAIEFDNSSTATSQKLRFSVHASNHTKSFRNHTNCTLDALLGAGWTLSCNGNVPGIFNNHGTPFTLIDCENQPALAPIVGEGAGQ
jgi:hypothetical protein